MGVFSDLANRPNAGIIGINLKDHAYFRDLQLYKSRLIQTNEAITSLAAGESSLAGLKSALGNINLSSKI